MADQPGASLPKQCSNWADLKAAYRLLSHPKIDAAAMQMPHRRCTMQQCAEHEVVLCIQDDTDLDFTRRSKVKSLGKIGDGGGRGVMQHSTLAVSGDGQLLGILDQCWFNRPEPAADETRRQRQARWGLSDVWPDAVEAVAKLRQEHAPATNVPGTSTRFVHVTDRGVDVWRTIRACDNHQMGFVIRAFHDRELADSTSRLWPTLGQQAVAADMKVNVTEQRDHRGRIKKTKRTAEVSIRYRQVCLKAPVNDPRCQGDAPRAVWAVHVREDHPPAATQAEPIDWVLLTSQPVQSVRAARRIIGWYRRRRLIEEWHRVIKEGCGLERCRLDDAADIARLACLDSVIAVRMLQIRDLAGFDDQSDEDEPRHGKVDDKPQHPKHQPTPHDVDQPNPREVDQQTPRDAPIHGDAASSPAAPAARAVR